MKVAGVPQPGNPAGQVSFRDRVYSILRRVPRGNVVTYGQLALLAGRPHAAWQVGRIAHAGSPDLPWHRIVNRFGGLAAGYDGGRIVHRHALEAEGIRVTPDLTVDLARYQWWPDRRNDSVLGRSPSRRRGVANVSRITGA